MKYLLVLVFTFYIQSATAQIFGVLYTGGYFTLKYVEKDIDKEIKKALKKNELTYTFKDTLGDTLVYTIRNLVDDFTTRLTFNLDNELYDEKFCDYQEYTFNCTPCAEKHLKEIIKSYNFRKKNNDVYLSKYSHATEMTIKYSSPGKECMTLSFRHIDIKKQLYKAEYKKLKKKKST
jgi:hypothetical protein